MALTSGQLNRATLARQLLLERQPLSVVEALERVVALQAQSPASPYLALWNRIAGFRATDLDAAYRQQRVLRASLMRIALHAVSVDDYPAFQHAMVDTLRAARLHDRRFKQTGLSIDDADGVVPDVLRHLTEPRRNPEMEAWLEARFGAPVPRLWWALRHYAPVVHAPTGGPWTHAERSAYLAAPVTPPDGDPGRAQQRLVRRYLEGFGPASAADVAQFTLLHRPVVRAALDALADELEQHEGPGGVVLYDVPGGLRPDEDVPAPPRLLGMWDLCLLAYADRSRVLPDEHRAAVLRRNGDVLPTILVDGHVAGVWRPVDRGIQAITFRKLPVRTWKALAAEAADLLAFLADRDAHVYRRHTHWFGKLSGAEERVLRD